MDNKLSELSKPVAEVVSKFGDPEAFGEREIKLLTGIQQMAYGTKFYSQEYVSALDKVAQFWIGESAGWKKRAEDAEKRIAELEAIRAAAEKLVRCKGRYHSEQNYRALAALFGVTTPDLPPVDGDNEAIIAELRAKLATPVRLPLLYSPDPWMSPDPDGTWLDKEDVKESIRTAGFTVEGDE